MSAIVDRSSPQRGEVWVYRGPPQETRRVLDRTLGGYVIYSTGRYTWRDDEREYRQKRCTWEDWNEWVGKARRKP